METFFKKEKKRKKRRGGREREMLNSALYLLLLVGCTGFHMEHPDGVKRVSSVGTVFVFLKV